MHRAKSLYVEVPVHKQKPLELAQVANTLRLTDSCLCHKSIFSSNQLVTTSCDSSYINYILLTQHRRVSGNISIGAISVNLGINLAISVFYRIICFRIFSRILCRKRKPRKRTGIRVPKRLNLKRRVHLLCLLRLIKNRP